MQYYAIKSLKVQLTATASGNAGFIDSFNFTQEQIQANKVKKKNGSIGKHQNIKLAIYCITFDEPERVGKDLCVSVWSVWGY